MPRTSPRPKKAVLENARPKAVLENVPAAQLRKELEPIPAGIWKQEHHARIWRAGKCGRCHIQPRSNVCARCQTPLCIVCDVEHRKEKCQKA